MNEIIKKLRIPGHEIKVIIKPRMNTENKETNGIQLSLDINTNQEKID